MHIDEGTDPWLLQLAYDLGKEIISRLRRLRCTRTSSGPDKLQLVCDALRLVYRAHPDEAYQMPHRHDMPAC